MKKVTYNILSLIGIAGIFVLALYAAQKMSQSSVIQTLVGELGYLAVLIAGIVAGLNTIVPLPAATFAPVFLAAGLSTIGIIITLAVGTLIADFIGFALGHISRSMIEARYPKLFAFFTTLQTEHHHLIIPVVILYASFVPFPNEAILIPLALAGATFGRLVIPLLIGNIIHQAVFIYGVNELLSLVPWL